MTDGTDNHLLVMNLRDKHITGSKVEYLLEKVGVSVNKNTIHGDKSAFSPSGIRIGMCAMTSRGFTVNHCDRLAYIIHWTISLAIKMQDIFGKKMTDFKTGIQRIIDDTYTIEEEEALDINFQEIKKEVRILAGIFHFNL